jgi:triosephosphate isomerase
MHKLVGDVVYYTKGLVREMDGVNNRDILICPPFTALSEVAKVVAGSNIHVGAQNMHYESKGAFTGEIAGEMLVDVNCRYVILGHSERRHIFKETDSFINQKVNKAIELGLKAILCVGELIDDRESGMANTIVKNQLENGLKGINSASMSNIIIAYEPVWAIGTGKTATPKDAQEMHSFIRKLVETLYDANVANNIIIQYGGSVKPGNISSLMSMDDIDGALVGGACLEIDSFDKIVKFN